MPIVGFNIEKITCERKSNLKGNLKVRHNVSLKDLKEEKIALAVQNTGVKVSFLFSVNYDPKFGEVNLEGHLLYLDTEEKVQNILNNWKKNKKIDPDLGTLFINTILTKCNIKALTFESEVNLPPHLPLPKVAPKTDVNTYIG